MKSWLYRGCVAPMGRLARLAAWLAVVALIAPAGMPRARASDAAAVSGQWLAQEHDGVITIGACGTGKGDAAELCGRLIGMQYTGAPPKDVWGRPQCGIVMLFGFKPGDEGRWDGRILDPQTGRLYSARIWSPRPGVLNLRGYILGMPFLGETQTWTRYHGKIGPECTMPP